MTGAGRSFAIGLTCLNVLLGSPMPVSAQAEVDAANEYANVGVLMLWRVDDAGRPEQLVAIASGTLIRDRVIVTAGHFTAPFKALGGIPPAMRVFASFNPTDARDPKTWIAVVDMATHPSMPPCPPPPQCDPTDDVLVAPLEPGITDIGLAFLERSPDGVTPAAFAATNVLDGAEGASLTIVGYGLASAGPRGNPTDVAAWDGKRRFRTSRLRKVIDDTWVLGSVPSYVCHGDSGGGIFLVENAGAARGRAKLVANVSDGGHDCRSHNNNVRLDTPGIQHWIAATASSARAGKS